MSDSRDNRARRSPPTAVQRAILEGSKPMLVTDDGTPISALEDERSTPVHMAHSPMARIEERQRDSAQGQLEIARGIGDLRIEQGRTTAALEKLVIILDKQEARAAREEERKGAAETLDKQLADKRDERKTTSREKILLALFVSMTAIGGYIVLRSPAPAIAPNTMTVPK